MEEMRQRNYRFPWALLERFEGAVAPSKRSAAVREAVREWLDRRGVPELTTTTDQVFADFGRDVLNPPDTGTLIRLADVDGIAEGSLLLSVSGEILRVRDVSGSVLAVDRGVDGTRVARINLGDRLVRLGDGALKTSASPVGSDLPVGGGVAAGGARGVGAEVEAGVDAVSTAPGPPASPAPDGERAVSAAAVQDGQGRARVVAPAPSDLPAARSHEYAAPALARLDVGRAQLEGAEPRADAVLDRAAAADAADHGLAPAAADRDFSPVELAPKLAAISGEPAAVWRQRLREGRISVAGRPFQSGVIDAGMLEFVELDGERVSR